MRIADLPDRVWRWLGHAALWLLFGVFGLVIGFVVLPFASLFIRNPLRRQRFARNSISACFKLFVVCATGMRLFTLNVSGMHHYQAGSGQLILANHPTLIDVVILISLFPQVDCVVKDAITRNPVLRMSVGAANYISNADPADLLDDCSERLRSGANLMLFPEGTRTIPGQPLVFKPGAAEIALRAGAPILPIVIDCRPKFLGKHDPWYSIPPVAPTFDIRVLAPVKPEQYV
ncbi:MAG: lysophospholipid acyltransferase family protein, partial [Pseudomonadota bacterium]